MIRAIIHAFFRAFFALLTRLHVDGKENIPETGGVIVAANHMSLLDAPLVFSIIDRKDLTAMVGDSYKKNPLIRPLVNAIDGIWIDRDAVDLTALRTARDCLRSGHALGIAPEGKRSHVRALIRAKTGVAYLADKAGVPIIPLAIEGTEAAKASILRLRRPKIVVHIGQPIILPPPARNNRDAALEHNTNLIMCSIAAMLPERYHGAYAEMMQTVGPADAARRPGKSR